MQKVGGVVSPGDLKLRPNCVHNQTRNQWLEELVEDDQGSTNKDSWYVCIYWT